MNNAREHESITPMNALPAGTQLNEYIVRSVIGEGGFGIVYLAHDTLLEREVAIKEFLPACFATRFSNLQVGARSADKQEVFERWRQRFVREAHILAKFRHPALVSVLRFFSANGTAYMVMPYYRGKTLRDMISSGYRTADTKSLLSILLPILTSLSQIHSMECYHLDVSADNILILENGSPVLLDFGSARYEHITSPQSGTVTLKPGFAPIEQYSGSSELAFGPWTDIYAASAVSYQLVTGNIPVISVGRTVRDTLTPLADYATPELSIEVLSIIDKGLSVFPKDRPQSIGEFIAALRSAVSRSLLPPEDAMDVIIGEDDEWAVPKEKSGAWIASLMQAARQRLNAASNAVGRLCNWGCDRGMKGFAAARRLSNLGVKGFLGAARQTCSGGMKGLGATRRLCGRAMAGLLGATRQMRGWGMRGLGAVSRLCGQGMKGFLGATRRLYGRCVATRWWGGRNFRVAAICMALLLTVAVLAGVLFNRTTEPVSISQEESTAVLESPQPQPFSDPGSNSDPGPGSDPKLALAPAPAVPESAPPHGDTHNVVPTLLEPQPRAEPSNTAGMVIVTVKPWGYVYLNGVKIGTAPPRIQKSLPDGTYRIEIRNDSGAVHEQTVKVSKGQTINIEHTFKRMN